MLNIHLISGHLSIGGACEDWKFNCAEHLLQGQRIKKRAVLIRKMRVPDGMSPSIIPLEMVALGTIPRNIIWFVSIGASIIFCTNKFEPFLYRSIKALRGIGLGTSCIWYQEKYVDLWYVDSWARSWILQMQKRENYGYSMFVYISCYVSKKHLFTSFAISLT